jgi:hypothetical protein
MIFTSFATKKTGPVGLVVFVGEREIDGEDDGGQLGVFVGTPEGSLVVGEEDGNMLKVGFQEGTSDGDGEGTAVSVGYGDIVGTLTHPCI